MGFTAALSYSILHSFERIENSNLGKPYQENEGKAICKALLSAKCFSN
jgi:hypothetical protein